MLNKFISGQLKEKLDHYLAEVEFPPTRIFTENIENDDVVLVWVDGQKEVQFGIAKSLDDTFSIEICGLTSPNGVWQKDFTQLKEAFDWLFEED